MPRGPRPNTPVGGPPWKHVTQQHGIDGVWSSIQYDWLLKEGPYNIRKVQNIWAKMKIKLTICNMLQPFFHHPFLPALEATRHLPSSSVPHLQARFHDAKSVGSPGLSHQRIPPQKSGWKISNKPAEAECAIVRRKKNRFPTISNNSKTNHWIVHQSWIMTINRWTPIKDMNKTKLKVTAPKRCATRPRRPLGVHISGVATMTRALANREVPVTGDCWPPSWWRIYQLLKSDVGYTCKQGINIINRLGYDRVCHGYSL